jgi:site-specific DNA-methyltransferase (adenine-specific)
MLGMKQFPDKYFGLAVVDPPYGIDIGSMNYTKSGAVHPKGRAAAARRDYRGNCEWDNQRPDKSYFDELFRISKEQIIWGGNYFSDMLSPGKSFIIWDKRVSDSMRNDFADCEYAWCSKGVSRMFRFVWNGMLQGDMSKKEQRTHPTQKPVALYKWILHHYANPGDIILDTHVGSASSLIACYDLDFQYVGFEINEEYYRLAGNRILINSGQCRMKF